MLKGIIACVLTVLAPATCQLPCEDGQHYVISDGHRSVSFVPGIHDSLLCDTYLIQNDKWYRFDHAVGGRMPESCVPVFHCGTQAPIWLQGSHPTEYNKAVTRQACANFGYPHDCCTWSAEINVVRCYSSTKRTDFYVYRLKRPPGCSIAYCAGDQMICPESLLYNNRTQKCEKQYPSFANVTLLPPVDENGFVTFYCKFTVEGPSTDNGATFEISFYFDNVINNNATVTLTAPNTMAALEERHLRFNLGKSVSCSVRSYWAGYRHIQSPAQYSNSYFAGILVEPTQLLIGERDDKPGQITLKSTLPITCKDPRRMGRCDVAVRVVTPPRLVATQNDAAQQCQYRFSKGDWDSAQNLAYDDSNPLSVSVRRDIVVHQTTTQVIQFEPFPRGIPDIVEKSGGGGHDVHYPIWDGYELPDVTVRIAPDELMGMCEATSDPRIGTWDGSGYDIIAQIGEFVLWRTQSARIFEVHVRHWLCRQAWFVACICAVAVRESNTVLSVDMCGGQQAGTPRPKVIQKVIAGQQLKGASVTRDVAGKTFSINMPSGSHVKIDIFNWGMNLYAFAPTEDINKTSGLCGSFDGDPTNDVTGTREDFIESWRVPKGTSLFDVVPEPAESDTNEVFCQCADSTQMICDYAERVDGDFNLVKPNIQVNPLKQPGVSYLHSTSRKKKKVPTATLR